MHYLKGLVDIVEDTMFAHAQLPDRRHMLKSGREAFQTFAPTSRNGRLMTQLRFNLVQDDPLIVDPQLVQLIHGKPRSSIS
jgi:hypothetical protein